MASNPIQIVLNTENYISFVDNPSGKQYKDFFVDRDIEFAAHKQKLLSQLGVVKKTLQTMRNSPVDYVKVVLQSEAWAKSHRPIGKIFDPQKTPCVGGNGIGEMFFEIRLDTISKIEESIRKAEEQTKWRIDKNGRKKPNPTAYKSEVGAIADILPHEIPDKRKFTIEQAVKWLSDPRTGGSLSINIQNLPAINIQKFPVKKL